MSPPPGDTSALVYKLCDGIPELQVNPIGVVVLSLTSAEMISLVTETERTPFF